MLLKIESTVDCKVVSMVDSFVGVQAVITAMLPNSSKFFIICHKLPVSRSYRIVFDKTFVFLKNGCQALKLMTLLLSMIIMLSILNYCIQIINDILTISQDAIHLHFISKNFKHSMSCCTTI